MLFRSFLLVVGGGINGDRHIVYQKKTPMTNLLLSMLDKVGVPADVLGDSTGRLPNNPLV